MSSACGLMDCVRLRLRSGPPLDTHPDRRQHQVIIDSSVYTCYHGVAGPLAIFGFPASEAGDHQSSAAEQSPLGRADWSIIS